MNQISLDFRKIGIIFSHVLMRKESVAEFKFMKIRLLQNGLKRLKTLHNMLFLLYSFYNFTS